MEGRRRGPSFWTEPPRITAFAPAEPIRHTDTSAFGDPQSPPKQESSSPQQSSADTSKKERHGNDTPITTTVFATSYHGAERREVSSSHRRGRTPEPAH